MFDPRVVVAGFEADGAIEAAAIGFHGARGSGRQRRDRDRPPVQRRPIFQPREPHHVPLGRPGFPRHVWCRDRHREEWTVAGIFE